MSTNGRLDIYSCETWALVKICTVECNSSFASALYGISMCLCNPDVPVIHGCIDVPL